MDMVPQKTPDSTHNFETDPIQTWIDGEWVKTKGTTLGADNGLGIAAIMAVMEDKTLKHGPIEALCTADEETGMYGANDLPANQMTADILLNLDTEDEGEMIVGSAGGINITGTIEYKAADTEAGDKAVKVTLKGLKGGHSGLEINEGRANATSRWSVSCVRLSASVMHDLQNGMVVICEMLSLTHVSLSSPFLQRTWRL